jgi:2-polyprenyl-6-methoxyphenol hydroxylase-like FAD-dependent oxidoreductase
VEEVLLAHAQTLPGVEFCFNTELLSFDQDVQRVTAQIRNLTHSRTSTVQADFLVGADGARSAVREGIGAKMEGVRGLSRNYNVVFHAPGLAEAHTHGPAIMYWHVNTDAPGLIGPMDQGDKWFFMPTAVPDGVEFSPSAAPDLIRKTTGINLPYEVLSSDEWVANRLLADRYRDRRVFLAGDACHLHPPFGGYGMNMGVADGVDLGWKMAAVLQGWGGATLLGSYEPERKPVHRQVMDEAVANHAVLGHQLWQDGLEDATAHGATLRRTVGHRIESAKLREFNTLGVLLGYRYDDSPVIVADGTPASVSDFLNYVPSARPGCLAPHLWLHDGSSLYDHFGKGFTLLITDGSPESDVDHVCKSAKQINLPLQILKPQGTALPDLYRARYALIRPDQHVAWRGDEFPLEVGKLLLQVSGRL